MSWELNLEQAIDAAQTLGISVEKFFRAAGDTWQAARHDATRLENEKLREIIEVTR